MTRMAKWVSISAGALLLLVGLVAVLLPPLVNLERYRTRLAQRVSRTLGRDVTLGALRVSFWGGIGAEARGIHIGQAAGFGAEPFMSAEALRIHVELLPLLRRQVKVASAVLERPRVRVVRQQDGRWSIDDLVRAPQTHAPAKAAVEPARPAKPPLFAGLVLSDVVVRDGEITLVEHSRPTAALLSLVDMELTLRHDGASDPIDLRARARLAGLATGQIEATARVTPAEKDGIGVDGTVTFAGVEAKTWPALASAGGDSPLIAGPVAGEIRLAGPFARSTLTANVDLKPAAVRIGGAFHKPAGEDARLAIEGRRDGEGIRLTRVAVAVRDTTITGTAHLPDVRVPRATFTATAARLDLDRLLADPEKRTWLGPRPAWAATPSQPRTAAAPGVSAQGTVRLGELVYHGVTWRAVDADVDYQGGILRLPNIRADVAQGRLHANGEADLRQHTPRVSFTSRLDKGATEPLLKALGVGPWTLKSTADFDGRFQFSGAALPAILASAVGNGSFHLRAGRLIDYRPLDELAQLVAPVLAAQGIRVRLNEFDHVNGHYTVDNGVARTADLTLTKPEGTITAAGTWGLLDSTLNFDVVAKFGRSTIAAKVTGTTAHPVVVPKLDKVQQRIEREIDKALPGETGKSLKEIFRGLFGR